MKELSIEEKAKRYDELKVTAQELEHDGCFDKITLFDLFPELKESDDERIRKEIIAVFKGQIPFTSEENGKKYIAWLEKQGEQNLIMAKSPQLGEQKSQGKSALEVWKDMRLEVYQQASGNRHEPNYSDDSTKMFSLTDIDEIFEKVVEKQNEQNPAWSEEDEQYLLVCKNALAKYQVSDKWDATIISRWLENK